MGNLILRYTLDIERNLFLSISNEKPKPVVSFGNFDSMTIEEYFFLNFRSTGKIICQCL